MYIPITLVLSDFKLFSRITWECCIKQGDSSGGGIAWNNWKKNMTSKYAFKSLKMSCLFEYLTTHDKRHIILRDDYDINKVYNFLLHKEY